MNEIKIGCIVLAAGRSVRFGADDKLLAELNGKRLIEWVLDSLPRECFCGLCAVASGAEVAQVCAERDFPCVRYPGGLLSDSIRAGLAALPEATEGVMFVNADRPFLRSDTLREMVEAFCQNPRSAVRLTWRGNGSNPVIFPKAARPELMALEGDRGGSALLKGGKYNIIEIEAHSEFETVDIDDMETLRRYENGVE